MSQQGQVGGFEVREKLGTGGMATVFMAKQTALDRMVVVKIMHPHLAEDKALVERFMHEARSAAALRHPNIVQVIDCGESDSTPYIAMEYIDGRDLKQFIVAHGIPPLAVSLLLIRDICLGLEHAHTEGVVHRDIKPGNIMLTSDGLIKIMDFGLARREEEASQMTMPGSVMGTPAYMSPEQAEGKIVSDRTDLFSLGILAYELISGIRPFLGESYAQVINAIIQHDPPSLSHPPVPLALITLVHQLLIKDPPSARPSAAAVRSQLEPLIQRFAPDSTATLLQEYARDPDGCKKRLAALNPAAAPDPEFDSAETVVHMPAETAPPVRDEVPEVREVPAKAQSSAPPEPSQPVLPVPPATRKKNLLPIGLILLAVSIAVVLLLIIQPWNNGEQTLPGPGDQKTITTPAIDPAMTDLTVTDPTGNDPAVTDPIVTDPTGADPAEAITGSDDGSARQENAEPPDVGAVADDQRDATDEPLDRERQDPGLAASLRVGILCKPAGRIMYADQCLNADGFWSAVDLKPGRHRLTVTRTGPPNDVIEFEVLIRGDEKYNKLILNLESGMVETDVTDLSTWQLLRVDQ